ncbi:uncharacterized protein LOC122725092 isoform X2 [Manihot esculenta]|uniref:uncharacterized protein LOC122725092 isoform X2 n=1 Tax=Manihot esculenta TaxID=3983 RepID=UPI001CC41FF0|nr:uncharacterized protein LOC122725092 isoform X2 [Manihot esculenta]
MAVELWRLAGFSTAVDFSIFMDFFIHIYNTFGRERTARMAIHAWKLWHARNERLWVNKVLSPSEVHHAASSYFNDYVASLVSRPRTLSHPSVPRVLPLYLRTWKASFPLQFRVSMRGVGNLLLLKLWPCVNVYLMLEIVFFRRVVFLRITNL